MDTIPVPPPSPIKPSLAATAVGHEDDFSFKDLFNLLNYALLVIRAKWYWGFLGALLIAGGVGYFLYKQPVESRAQTALVAQSSLDKVIGTQTEGGGDQARENSLRNHLSMMSSRKFRARLAAAFTPGEQAAIAAPYLKPGQTADADFFQNYFASKVLIERERGREYYTITVTHLDPKLAISIADRLAVEYLAYVQQEFKAANLQGYAILEKQADIIRNDVAKVESAGLDFRKKNGIISRADNQGILAERLKRLDASLTEIRIKRVGLETQSQQATADRAKSEYPWDNAYLASFANNESLRQELDRQVADRGVLASRYGPNHPKLRDVDSHIKGIQSAIQRNFDIAVRDLVARLDVVLQTERLIKKEFDDAFDSSIEIEKLASNYEILSAGVSSKRYALIELEKKISEASISSKLPADFMQIVDPAYIVQPRIPKRILYAGVVALLALISFVTFPLVAGTLNERVSGMSDMEETFGLTLLGAIPNLKMRSEDRAHVVRDNVDVVRVEAFATIMGQLDIGTSRGYPKVIVISSTLPGEGKSLLASNLTSVYRQYEKKTLLIDLDLRRPSQHTLHGLPASSGFLAWANAGFPMAGLLEPGGPLEIRRLPDGSDFISAGEATSQPGHFLVAKAMEQLFTMLSKRYETVIVDTPPAGVFQDALVLSRYSTERVLVAREGVAPVEQVKTVIEDFSRANRPFQGMVLNGFSPGNANRKLAYAYKAANKGYGYTSEAKKQKSAAPA